MSLLNLCLVWVCKPAGNDNPADLRCALGQSGTTVKPDMIINIAISGSVQYQVGMKNSKCVVSINHNAASPIFDISHYGAVADFGAEVIHIERPGVGDTPRVLAPFAAEDGKTVSTSWAQDGRNKLSLSLELNLKHPEVKELFFGLIREADVFMENMVWLEKLGIRDNEGRGE